MVTKKHPDSTYRQYVEQLGFNGMFYDGLEKVSQGLTTLEEVYRVIV